MITSAKPTEKAGSETLSILELAEHGLLDLKGEPAKGSW